MNKNFIVYLPSGQILRTGTCSENDYQYQVQDGELIMEGTANSGTQYIENGAVVDLPAKPEGEYKFDYTNKTWVANTELAAAIAYGRRDQLLRDGPDRISPVWWASMTTADQLAWMQYRQALLDIPQQPGFPMNVVYPERPA